MQEEQMEIMVAGDQIVLASSGRQQLSETTGEFNGIVEPTIIKSTTKE